MENNAYLCPVSCVKELSARVFPFLRRGVFTNAFLSPETYASEIAEGRLFTHTEDGFLGIFLSRDDFYSLYVYVLGEKMPPFPPSLPLICEIAGDAPACLSEELAPFFSRVHLSRAPSETAHVSSDVRPLSSLRAREGFSLLSECFDPRTAALPTFTEFCRDCEKGNVLEKTEDGTLAGLLRFSCSAKRAEIKHLCVHPDRRKQGVAALLCESFLAVHGEKTVSVFTGSENRAARALYESFGFVRDEITSTVYQKGVSV